MLKNGAYRCRQAVFVLFVKLLQALRPKSTGNRAPRLVLFKPDGIGDWILSSGCIRLLGHWAKSGHGMETTLIVGTCTEALARREFPEFEVIAIPPSHLDGNFGAALSTIGSLRRAAAGLRCGVLINLRHQVTLTQDLILCWLRPERSFGLTSPVNHAPNRILRARRFEFSNSLPYPPVWKPGGHPLEVEAQRTLAELVLGKAVSDEEVAPRLGSFKTSDNGTVVVFPFAMNNPKRNYPRASQIEALAGALAGSDLEILLCGSGEEAPLLEEFGEALRGKVAGPVHISTPATFVEACEQIASARAIFCMDSGPAHVAIALDKPGVFLLGGGHFGSFAPYGDPQRQKWLFHQLPCYHCEWNCPYETVRCIERIPVSAVRDALRDVLAA